MRSADPIDVIIVLTFLLGCLVVGLVFAGRQRRFDTFVLADRRLGTFHTTATIISTIAGFSIVVAHSIYGYTYGISVMWSPPAILLAFVLFSMFAGRLKRAADQHGYSTYADMLLQRYDRKTQILGSIITVLNFLSLSAINIFGIGLFLTTMLGWPTHWSVVVGAGIVVVYTLLGGFLAVVWTDAIQFIVTAIGFAILVPAAAIATKSVGGLVANLPPESLEPTTWGLDKIVGTYFVIIPVFFSSQDIWQRVFAARDEKTARRGIIIGGIVVSIAGVCAVYLGMCARALHTDLDPQLALPILIQDLVVPGLAGVVLAAYLAAFTSSADSFLLVVASAITQDYYRSRDRGGRNERTNVIIARACIVICGALCIAIVIAVPDIVTILFAVLTWLMILVPATLAGFFWSGATANGAFWSIVAGVVIAMTYAFAIGDMETAGVVAFPPTVLVLFIVSKADGALGGGRWKA